MALTRGIAALVARRVREIRGAKGWTQVRLAADAGLARATIATIEAGHDVPSLDTLEALATSLHVPPASLLLDPKRSARHALAVAALTVSETSAKKLAELLGAGKEPL